MIVFLTEKNGGEFFVYCVDIKMLKNPKFRC